MKAPTILLLSATSGFGHVKAGRDIERRLRQVLPSWHISHRNAFDFFNPLHRALLERGWQTVSERVGLGAVYSIFYRKLVGSDHFAEICKRLSSGAAQRLDSEFSKSDVRLVLALHPSAAVVAAHWKKDRKFRLGVVATDLIIHAFQALSEVDFLCADQRSYVGSLAAADARRNNRVKFTGLPTEAGHFTARSSTGGTNFNVLVVFGAYGMRAERHISKILAAAEALPWAKFCIVCGLNENLRRECRYRIRNCSAKQRFQILGYEDDMASLIAESNLVIGKPGGITLGEILAQRKQFIILDWLPGQEEFNLQILLQSGFGVIAKTADDIVRIAQENREGSPSFEDRSAVAFATSPGIEAIVGEVLRQAGIKEAKTNKKRRRST